MLFTCVISSLFIILILPKQLFTVKTLIAAGANVNLSHSTMPQPIVVAASLGHLEIVQQLLLFNADASLVRSIVANSLSHANSLLPLILPALPSLLSLQVSLRSTRGLIPASLPTLRCLTSLSINFSDLTVIPLFFSMLTSLTSISLSENRIYSLPHSLFCRMTNLSSISLRKNKLSELPLMSPLPKLNTLDISYNSFSVLPSVALRPQLAFHFEENPLDLQPCQSPCIKVFVPSLRELSASAYIQSWSTPQRKTSTNSKFARMGFQRNNCMHVYFICLCLQHQLLLLTPNVF